MAAPELHLELLSGHPQSHEEELRPGVADGTTQLFALVVGKKSVLRPSHSKARETHHEVLRRHLGD